MAMKFYQVTKDGKDIPGVRWASEQTAKDTLEIEMDCDLINLRKEHPEDNYISWIYKDDGIGIITKERREAITDGFETIYSTEVHRYAIRIGEVGEKRV